MPVFDELNKRQRLNDPEEREAEELRHETPKKKYKHNSSVSIRTYKSVGIIVTALSSLIAVGAVAYAVWVVINLFIYG